MRGNICPRLRRANGVPNSTSAAKETEDARASGRRRNEGGQGGGEGVPRPSCNAALLIARTDVDTHTNRINVFLR